MKISTKIQKLPAIATPGILKKIEKFYAMKSKLIGMPLGAIPSDLFEKILKTINKASETYSFFGEAVIREEIPRDATMVCGSSFTSEQFPQPIDSTGRPMYPVLQLDLEWIGSITNRKFKQEILQLWWSPFDLQEKIINLPKSHVIQSSATSLVLSDEISSEIVNWIPDDWVGDIKNTVYQITGCKNIGVTFPNFDYLIDDYLDCEIEEDHWNLICDISNDDQFHSAFIGKKKSIFKLFGYYKSNSCAPWETESDLGFLHTSQWSAGMMYANIFMRVNNDGLCSNFNFGFGR